MVWLSPFTCRLHQAQTADAYGRLSAVLWVVNVYQSPLMATVVSTRQSPSDTQSQSSSTPTATAHAGSIFDVSIAGLSDPNSRSTARQTYLYIAGKLLNKNMRNDELLEQIYNDVKALGLVEDQWTFSNMCGRTGTWFSCIKNRNLPMTSDAFLTLSHNVRTRAVELIDAKQHSAAMILSERLIEQAQAQIGRKQMRLSGCSP